MQNAKQLKGDTEPNETTEKNIQSNNAADKDNEISENSEENKIDPKDSNIEILEVIREPKVNEVVKKLTEDAESKSSEVVDEVKTETESDNNKSEGKEREATKPVTEKDNEVTDDKETKTDNNEDDNENEAKMKSEDQEKIWISKSFVAITARPTRERGETRAKYMCRLAGEF